MTDQTQHDLVTAERMLVHADHLRDALLTAAHASECATTLRPFAAINAAAHLALEAMQVRPDLGPKVAQALLVVARELAPSNVTVVDVPPANGPAH